MEGRHVLEIQNRTPFALTWVHLERDGTRPDEAPRNLLSAAIPAHRGRVIGAVESGPARLVCGFEAGPEPLSFTCPRMDLDSDGATSACVRHDEERGFTFDAFDGRAREGEGRSVGPYRWNGRSGRTHDKRGRRLRGRR